MSRPLGRVRGRWPAPTPPFEVRDGMTEHEVHYLQRFGYLQRLEGETPIDASAVERLRAQIAKRDERRTRRSA